MRHLRRAAVVMLVFVFAGIFVTLAAQGPFNVSYQQLEPLTVRLVIHSDSFRQSMKAAIAHSFLKDAPVGVYMKGFAQEFSELAGRLKKRLGERKPISSEVQEVLNRAEHINSFMNSYDLDPQAKRDWQLLRNDLDQLAIHYRIVTHWNTPVYLGRPQTVNVEAAENRLIGTYKLDASRINEVRDVVQRALRDLPLASRVRLQIPLMRHLRDSKLLAIDRDGWKVKFGSSLQPARAYEIVDRAQTGDGERVNTLLFGNQFRINTGSDSDGLYSVTFCSTNLGSKLEVIRIAFLSRFKRPVVASSYYTKISDAAEFDLSEEEGITPLPLGRYGLQKKK